jgi:hypothetical protein
MGGEDETRKQVEEDAKEDLELKDEDADKIGGGEYQKLLNKEAREDHKIGP